MRPCHVFFRNDDVHCLEPGLSEVTGLLNAFDISICHAVEPDNMDEDVRSWLLDTPPDLVEIIQHGYSHECHDRGEFGGRRSREDQKLDMVAGLEIMRRAFGDRFFPAMSFPFGSYNQHSIPLLEELGFKVVSCHQRCQFSRRIFYALGRALGRGRWLDRHVSHHLRNYPGTRIREISVSISPIRVYNTASGPTSCVFWSLEDLQRMFRACRRTSPVVGIVLHHRYHGPRAGLRILEDFVTWMIAQDEVRFTTIAGVQKFCNRI